MAIHKDKEGCHITQEGWRKLRENDDYVVDQKFDNGVVRVTLEWLGFESESVSRFPVSWRMWQLHVFNYADAGKLVPDPVENGRTFPNKQEAKKAYRDLLVRWTDSHYKDGIFVEEGNKLAPPPPPDPNVPVSQVEMLGDVGAW